MKKISSIMTGIVIAFLCLIFSGCDENESLDRTLAESMMYGDKLMSFLEDRWVIYEKNDGESEWTKTLDSNDHNLDGNCPSIFAIRHGKYIEKVLPAGNISASLFSYNEIWKQYLDETSQNIELFVSKDIQSDFETGKVTIGSRSYTVVELNRGCIRTEKAYDHTNNGKNVKRREIKIYKPTESIFTAGADALYFGNQWEAGDYMIERLHDHFGDTIPVYKGEDEYLKEMWNDYKNMRELWDSKK